MKNETVGKFDTETHHLSTESASNEPQLADVCFFFLLKKLIFLLALRHGVNLIYINSSTIFRIMMNIRSKYFIIHGMVIQNLTTGNIIIGTIALFRIGIQTLQRIIQQVIIVFLSTSKVLDYFCNIVQF